MMRKSTLLHTAWLLLVAAFFSGCAVPPRADTPASAIDGSAWTMPLAPGDTATQRMPTLSFAGGSASGSDGCNRFTGSYTTTPGKLQFSQLARTQMACPLEDDAQLARVFMDGLEQTRGYRIEGGRLLLLDASNAELFSLQPQATGLAGTAWQATAYNNGRQAVVGVIQGTALRLQFLDGGQVAGSGGCNNFSGSWRLDGQRLSIGPLAATRKACAQPEGVMAQEAAFLRALESAATARREGSGLELRTGSDALAAKLTLDAPAKP